jgi:glucose/arabinose dehydrogenase
MKKIILLAFLFSTLVSAKGYKTEVLVSGDDPIWGFDFLKDGRVIYTERSGKLYLYNPKDKTKTALSGVPKVYAVGQGGLLDVRVHPKNDFIYLTYSEPLKAETSTTAFARAKIGNNVLIDFKKLFSAEKASDNDYHYGSRIEFDEKGHIFITVGERGERDSVQKLDNHLGKIIRLNEDGTAPNDNPYVADKKAKPEVWARGIRSPQGLAFRPGTNELWEAEMGPMGGDEVNIIEAGKDYGWPVVTYGREYYGLPIGEGKTKKGVEDPIVFWVPSISPSGMAFYAGDKMPEWKGNLFLALLSGQHLRRLTLDGKKVVAQEELFKDLDWRFRNVRTGPDGYLWFSTDEGKLGRILVK